MSGCTRPNNTCPGAPGQTKHVRDHQANKTCPGAPGQIKHVREHQAKKISQAEESSTGGRARKQTKMDMTNDSSVIGQTSTGDTRSTKILATKNTGQSGVAQKYEVQDKTIRCSAEI